jgi:type VI secretion system protein ImpH
MALADRTTTRDLADQLLGEARNYAFFPLVEHLHALHDDNLEDTDIRAPAHQRVRLANHAGLGFPAADVACAEHLTDEADGRYRVEATFFGLHGPDSPLPGDYLDVIAQEAGQGEGIRAPFLDFFNHRLLSLLHVAWRKYRYYIRFRPQASDPMSAYLFALVGLHDADLRGATPLPWSRLLTYAGLIAGRSRAPSVVAGIIAHCFDLSAVAIREFESRVVAIPAAQRMALGVRNGALGDSFMVGSRVRTLSTKFTIVIGELDQQRFRDFLPSGADFPRLRSLMEFLLRDPMAYDLQLGLKREHVPPFSLHRAVGAHLGWTSFLGDDAHRTEAPVRIRVRA